MTITDTQTGLRAIPRADLTILNSVWGDRFEYETNMLLAMKEKGIPFDEVKIRTVYIEENKSSHFHPIRDSWRIYKLILSHFFKYTASSLFSSVIDTGLYVLLAWALGGLLNDPLLTAISVTAARIVSSLVNFYINQKLVFKSSLPTGKSMLRYLLLAVCIFLGQFTLTYGVYMLMGIGEAQIFLRGLVYVIVMTALFVVSYMAQKRWVFSNKRNAN
jgi:putative flippase GtrA